jgi:hypothetical protein
MIEIEVVGGLSAQYLRRLDRDAARTHSARRALTYLQAIIGAIPPGCEAAHPISIIRRGRTISQNDLSLLAHQENLATQRQSCADRGVYFPYLREFEAATEAIRSLNV